MDEPCSRFVVQFRAVVNQAMNFIFLKRKQQRKQRPEREKNGDTHEEWSRAVHERWQLPRAVGWSSSVATVHCDTSFV